MQDPEPAASSQQGLKYALFGAIALIAFLVGALAVVVFTGDDDDPVPAEASSGDSEDGGPADPGDSESDDADDDGDPSPEATAADGGESLGSTASGGSSGGTGGGQPTANGGQGTFTPSPTPTPVPEVSSPTTQPQQSASPTATSTSQHPPATPTQTPTKPTATATKTATKAATATKTATPTPTKTATPTPTVPPTIVPNSDHFLFVELDDSNSVTGSVARPAGPLGAQIIVSITFEGSAQKARVIVQGTCTGTGAQHVRFHTFSDGELIPCNRTLVDVEVQKSGNVPKTVAIIEVAALDTGNSNVQWTIAATTLAIP